MVFCKACARDLPGHRDADGLLSCSRCGKVLKFDNFSNEATFVKGASGQSQLSGRFVRSIEAENQSRERLYERARDDLTSLKNGLGMGDNMAMVDQAMKYYRIAVERNFTKGRRTEQVQAACLYIACRENRRPYLLIDFSIYLKINVYVLGAVFLQLCKVLNLTEHPICQKLHDPSIFIHKYTASLAGGKNKDISQTALNIIASMNRDWLQTGRRPGGLWGAAVYVSALAHGLKCTKEDILQLVHVCEATLTRRLVEFENTESGSLTIEELNAKAEELKESAAGISQFDPKQSRKEELLCQHRGTSVPPYAYGLCQDCFAIFVGFEGGSDPPAFQCAEKQRMQTVQASEKSDDTNVFEMELPSHGDGSLPCPDIEKGSARSQVDNNDTSDEMHGVEDTSSKVIDETDTLSDIDDAEVDVYLHNEDEKRFKKVIWETLNREYLEEQAAKEAAAAAAKEAWEANFKNCPEDMQAAKDFEASVVASRAKSKKERQQQRAAELKNLPPPKSAAEAAHRMLTKKRPSSKINYEALEKLFDDEPASKDTKKMKTATDSDNKDDLPPASVQTNKDEGSGLEHDDGEDDGEAYANNFDDYNVDDSIYHDDGDSDYNDYF